jgi:hypothetical protein
MRQSLRPKREFEQVRRTRYLEPMVAKTKSTALAGPVCAVNFWTFAIPVIVGNLVAMGTGYATKKAYNGDHASTQEAAMFATKAGAFWVAAGLTWIYMAKRNGAAK